MNIQAILHADTLTATHWFGSINYAKHTNGFWYRYDEGFNTWELSYALKSGQITEHALRKIEE